jgi:prepilin-type processing-associated H-X9-DG protein
VELLVVIGIISLLMALLLPAVNAARQTAQVTKCAFRMGELGKAMIAYDVVKQHLPGFANTVHGQTVGWPVTLLPYIGRNDLWEGGTTTVVSDPDCGWRIGGTASSYIDLYVCPSDYSPVTKTPLSFAVSLGSSTALADTTGASATGLFRNITVSAGSATRTVSITDVKSRSQRPMIVENACTNVSPERQWNACADAYVTAERSGFVWPPSVADQSRLLVAATSTDSTWSNGTFGPTGSGVGYFPPIHTGGRLNVTFCDGSVRTITRTDPDNVNDPAMRCNKFDCTQQQ